MTAIDDRHKAAITCWSAPASGSRPQPHPPDPV